MLRKDEQFEMVVTTIFGLEALATNELKKLGIEILNVADGRITFKGTKETLTRVNMWLRTGERVLIKVGSFTAVTFDELFEGTKALDWPHWLPKDCEFPVNGFSIKSTLFSIRDCQAIIKKAIVDSLRKKYKLNQFPETGSKYRIEFSIQNDVVTLMIDSSGDGLHKRGYRKLHNLAPLKETIAAGLVTLSRFSYNGVFADPFCGSGTIPIETGMIAKNIAPGLTRKFAAENFPQFPAKLWQQARMDARDLIRNDTKIRILASDIDPDAVELTKCNAKLANVADIITVKQAPISEFTSTEKNGTIVCNPPYGERLLDIREAKGIIKELGAVYKKLDNWSLFVISPIEDFEMYFGGPANKKRKLYNGMIKCDFYQYIRNR